jgi:post-segregation antitoxin (ccd killing protein)
MEHPRPTRETDASAVEWLAANSNAILEANAWLDANGLPLAGSRLF